MAKLSLRRFPFSVVKACSLLSLGSLSLAVCACDEEAPKKMVNVADEVDEPAPLPIPKSPPRLSVDEGGPMVRGMGVLLLQDNGAPNRLGLEKLRSFLQDEKDFITGKELTLQVERKAVPAFVTIFLTELASLSPSKLSIETPTRGDFPKVIEFVPEEQLDALNKCTLVGTVTEDRGTAIWRVSGGTARKRGRGMGGPDLSMAAETIDSMSKKCDSDLFFITGVEGVDWGLVYDLGAAGISSEKAGLSRAVLPLKRTTAGRALKL